MSDGITDGSKVNYVHKNYYLGASDLRLCEDAIAIQDASNLAAIVTTLKDMIVAVRERDNDWKAASTHPAIGLVVLKITDMVNIKIDYESFAFRYCECKEMIKNDSVHNE